MTEKDSMTAKRAMEKRNLKLGALDSIRFNVMVAGVGGIGKTTFLKLFFQLYRRDGSQVSLQLSERPKTVKTLQIEEMGRFVLDADNVQVDFHLIDTPGYGDSINNQHAINNVKKYIENAHKHWSELDIRSMSRQEMNAADKRVHCIFYFIPAHRMKIIDSEFIVQLASLAPIVPIIAKADTMTYQERKDYLMEIRSTFEALKTQTSYPILFDFKESSDVGFLHSSPCSTPRAARVPPVASQVKDTPSLSAVLQGANYDSQTEDEVGDVDGLGAEEEEEEYEMHTVTSESSSEDHKPVEGLEGTTLGSYFYNGGLESSTPSAEKTEQQEAEAEAGAPGAATPMVSVTASLPRIPNVFAVVCDTSPNGLREFPYGTLEIYNKEHSDFRRLQELFFESGEHILKMRRQTERMSIVLFQESRKVTAWQRTALSLLKEGKRVLNRILLAVAWGGLLAYLVLLVITLGDTTKAGKYVMCFGVILNKLLK